MTRTLDNKIGSRQTYSLVTSAYNEEKYIEKLLDSVTSQTVPPKKWVIVSDGSTDRTDEIVQSYAERYSFVELYRITEDHPRNLTAQVHAINVGFARLTGVECDFIGNLDSDVSFEKTYFESLLKTLSDHPDVGLAGGYIYEEKNGKFQSRPGNTLTSVAHAVQLFRRQCFEILGGYKPFSWAGADTYAEVSLRMNGWRTESVPELKVFHHRPTGNGFGSWRYKFRGGVMDFYIGTHPLFEIVRVVRRLPAKPYVVGSLVRLSGFVWGYCSGTPREVSSEFIQFLRDEQMGRLGLSWMRQAGATGKRTLSATKVGEGELNKR